MKMQMVSVRLRLAVSLREAGDTESQVECQCPRRDGLDLQRGLLAHLHDGALAVLLLDLPEGHLECLISLHCGSPCYEAGRLTGRPPEHDLSRGLRSKPQR